MKASAVLNDKDVWAMAPREEKSNNSTSFLFRMGKEDWIWFLFAEQRGPKGTVQLFNQFNELIECCCSIGVWWSWVWFVFVELGGLWAVAPPMAPPKEANQTTNQTIQSNKEEEREWSEPSQPLNQLKWKWIYSLEWKLIGQVGWWAERGREEWNELISETNWRNGMASGMAHAQFVERRETNGAMLLAQPITNPFLHSKTN